jgi:hypothetical protein
MHRFKFWEKLPTEYSEYPFPRRAWERENFIYLGVLQFYFADFVLTNKPHPNPPLFKGGSKNVWRHSKMPGFEIFLPLLFVKFEVGRQCPGFKQRPAIA